MTGFGQRRRTIALLPICPFHYFNRVCTSLSFPAMSVDHLVIVSCFSQMSRGKRGNLTTQGRIVLWCLPVFAAPNGGARPVIPRGSTVHFSAAPLVPLAPGLWAKAPARRGGGGGATGGPVAGRGQPSESAAPRTAGLIPQQEQDFRSGRSIQPG